MVPPDSSFHCQTRATNASRPRSSFVFPSSGELLLDLDLGGDSRVVGAGKPQRVEAVHALVADQDVLQRVVQGVAPVQRAGDVGRGITIAYGRRGEAASAWKYPRSSQKLYQRVSTLVGIVAIGHVSHWRAVSL